MAPGRRIVWFLVQRGSSSRDVLYGGWQQQQQGEERRYIIILSHYTTIIAHFSPLVKPFAHFLADVEEWINRSFCVVIRLRRLICFHRQAYRNESVFIILFESSKTPHWPRHHMSRARASIGFSAKNFTARQSCGLKDINRLGRR